VLNSHDGQAVTVVMIADWKACRERPWPRERWQEEVWLSVAGVRRPHSRLTGLKLRLNDRFFLKSSLL
jgi:hypothetical protein